MITDPAPKYQKIFQRREHLYTDLVNNFRLNELEAVSLEKEIKKTLVDPNLPRLIKGALHHELGCIYSYQLKLNKALEQMDIAERFGIDEFGNMVSKCLIYNLHGELSKSRSALESWKSYPSEPNIDRSILSHAVETGMFDLAKEIILRGNSHHEDAIAAAELIEGQGIDSALVTERLEVAAKIVIKETKKPFLAFNLFAMKNEGMLYEIIVDGTVEELIALDEKINDQLIELFGFDSLAEILSISISPYVDGMILPVNYGYHVTIS